MTLFGTAVARTLVVLRASPNSPKSSPTIFWKTEFQGVEGSEVEFEVLISSQHAMDDQVRRVIDEQFDRAVEIVQGLPKSGPVQTGYEEKLAMYR